MCEFLIIIFIHVYPYGYFYYTVLFHHLLENEQLGELKARRKGRYKYLLVLYQNLVQSLPDNS